MAFNQVINQTVISASIQNQRDLLTFTVMSATNINQQIDLVQLMGHPPGIIHYGYYGRSYAKYTRPWLSFVMAEQMSYILRKHELTVIHKRHHTLEK